MNAFRVGSLFAGIGGFDLAFELAGASCAWQVEIDDDANQVLARHWPDVPRYRDVRAVGAHNLAAVDCIVGGFPCQDVSVAGRRAGLAGERSGLWSEFARILGECRPGWVVVENVPGLLSSNDGRDFAVVLHGLVALGYRVAWRVLDAQFFGVPQRRRRVFLVGHLGDGRAAEVLFKSDGGQGHPPPRRETGSGITPILEVGARTSGDGYRDGDGIGGPGDAMVTLQATKQHGIGIDNRLSGSLPGSGAGTMRPGGHRGEHHFYIPVLAHSVTASAGHHGHSSPRGDGGDDLIPSWLRTNPQVAGTLAASGAVTRATAGQQNEADFCVVQERNLAQSGGVRRLTPTECERLQGFPDGWTASQPDHARYKQLGNAVAVPVVRWLADQILGTHEIPVIPKVSTDLSTPSQAGRPARRR